MNFNSKFYLFSVLILRILVLLLLMQFWCKNLRFFHYLNIVVQIYLFSIVNLVVYLLASRFIYYHYLQWVKRRQFQIVQIYREVLLSIFSIFDLVLFLIFVFFLNLLTEFPQMEYKMAVSRGILFLVLWYHSMSSFTWTFINYH